MKVIIIGGGVGGLTAALMLHARGIDCELYEQSDTVRELGVGINTLPHAIKELAELGLLERLDAVGIRTYELFYTNRFGQEIWRELRGTDAGYEVPQFSIHRGRLQAVIYQAVRARLGESRIHTGHRLGAFRQDEGGVTAYFFDRHGSIARPRAAMCLSAPTAFIRWCATRSIRTKGRRAGTAPCSGAGRSNGRAFSPAAPWSSPAAWRRSSWSIPSRKPRGRTGASPTGPWSPRSATARPRRRTRKTGRGRDVLKI